MKYKFCDVMIDSIKRNINDTRVNTLLGMGKS